MRKLLPLALRLAVTQGLAFLLGYFVLVRSGALEPHELAGAAAGMALTWAVGCAAIVALGSVVVRPLAEPLAGPRPLPSDVAARAARAARRVPALGGALLLAIGAGGCAIAGGWTFFGQELPLDVAVASLGIGLSVALLGAMVAYALCSRAVAAMAQELDLSLDRGARGTLRGKIVLLGLGLSAIGVTLVGATGYLLHRATLLAVMPRSAPAVDLEPMARSMGLAALVAFAGAAVLAWLAASAITQPLHSLGEAADRIASGDLTVRTHSFSGDEMGRLATRFRSMAQGLTGLVREVQTASANVSSGAIEATSIGERVRQGALEQHLGVRAVREAVDDMESSMSFVSRGVGGLSDYVSSTGRAVGEMAEAFEEVQRKASELERAMAAAMGDVESLGTAGRDAEGRLTALESLAARSGGTLAEVKASVAGLERAAGESEETAASVAQASDRAGLVMEGTVHGIETLRGAVADAHQRIAALGRRSDDIDQVVDFISEVAGRTNLLSLNASIIAAQAGEHGKTFSVVADQIRDLAAQIARSTKSIGDIIRAVRADVEGTAALIDRGDALAAEGVQLTQNALDALGDVRRLTARGRDTAAGIRTAVQAHAQSSREMANLVELVAEGSRAVTAAVGLVGRSVGGVHSVSRGVTGMADRVARTLEEQAGLGRRQMENLSRLEAMIREITNAVVTHEIATEHVKKALEHLSLTAGEHESAVHGLYGVADQIGARARALSAQVNRFKV